jgi:xanthine/CO dehydrogenase XdhC/CoxF family maturation factor
MADILGWETTVVDGGPIMQNRKDFVSACQVLVAKPENVLEQIVIDEHTVFLLMTHNYNYDMAICANCWEKCNIHWNVRPKEKKRTYAEELKMKD